MHCSNTTKEPKPTQIIFINKVMTLMIIASECGAQAGPTRRWRRNAVDDGTSRRSAAHWWHQTAGATQLVGRPPIGRSP